jgi:hypothetical protein
MSLIFATQLTAVATAVLAVFAIFTAWYARRAFLKQSQEVRAIESQVKDQQEVTRQQAELLKIQSGQLELQHQQFEDQIRANAMQAEVLELQASELRGSLDERKREAAQFRSAQAARIFVSQANFAYLPDDPSEVSEIVDDIDLTDVTNPEEGWETAKLTVVNSSDQPIYDAQLRWHRGSASHGWPNPEPLGTIMPGSEIERSRHFPLDTNMAVSGAILMFRDATGVRWIRRPDGGLVEQQ